MFEDDPTFHAVLTEVLTDEGFEARACSSYEELCTAASQPDVRLVLADWWGESYLDLSAADRQQIWEVAHRAPTILLTGRAWAHPGLRDELGLVSLLTKPINIEDLLAQVARCTTRDGKL